MATAIQKNWGELSDEELTRELTLIVNKCSTTEEVNEQAKETLGYPYHIACTFTSSGGMTMGMGMAWSKDGHTLHC